METIYLREEHRLAEFTQWVNEFCIRHNVPNLPYNKEEVNNIINRGYDQLQELTSEECFSSAMILMNYAGYLQRESDYLRTLQKKCIHLLNHGYSLGWESFDKYMPADIKKQSIVDEIEHLQRIQENELRLSSGVQMLEKQCEDIRNRANLYKEMGKKR